MLINNYNLEIEIFQYLIKNTEPRIFRENNHRDIDKNYVRTFEPRGGKVVCSQQFGSLD